MSDFEDHLNEKRKEERDKNKGLNFEGTERRMVSRIRGIIVEYKKHGSRDTPRSAFLRDMSPKGLSVSVNEKFEVGEVLDLNVYLTGAKHPAVVEAKVRWVKTSEYFKKSDKKHYDAGLKICSAEDWDLRLIRDYMERHKMDGGN